LCHVQFFNETNQQTQLKLERIETTMIPIPPIEEQKRIVAKVGQLMALCDQLETKFKQTQTTSEKLVEASVSALVA
jgi:type I restriction enzyme S subunit